MVLEQIANLSLGVIRVLGSSPSRTANFKDQFSNHNKTFTYNETIKVDPVIFAPVV